MKIRIEYDIPDESFYIHSTLDYMYEKDGIREWDSQEKFTQEIQEVKDD